MRMAWYLGIASLVLPVLAYSAESKDAEQLQRGLLVYQTYCVNCHGTYADGKGKSAKNLKPRPANLRTSDKTDQYKEKIIRQGGAAVGRSPFMPPWEQELTKEQIVDILFYLQSININKPAK